MILWTMMLINFKPTKKQHEVFKYFEDENTTEVLMRGSVGSAKSYLIAAIIVMQCLKHPGIRIGLAREHLTVLKKTTLTSVFEIFSDWGLGVNHYTYNSQAGEIKFTNGSAIILVELCMNPSDPQYTRLGGLLLTFGVIDEAGEIDEKGKEIFQSRLGRWQNDKFGVKPFLLMTANPSKNFLYRDFYLAKKEGRIPEHRKFVQALPSDNPYLPKSYIENLSRTMSLSERRRLIGGEWEVQDEADALFTQRNLDNMFDLSIQYEGDRTRRISADIAFTSDRCVFVVWEGPRVIDIVIRDNNNGTVVSTLTQLATDHRVRPDNVAYDADGVGLYLREYFPSAREIHNGAKPLKNTGYNNLKTELFFRLSEMAETGELKIVPHDQRNAITEELSVIKHKPRQSMNNSIELISKIEMKRILGRSPDIADALAYGMIFHLQSAPMEADDFVFIDF